MKNSAIDTQFLIFNESQIKAIKLIINKNFWGDCDQEYADGKTYETYGYYTNTQKGKEWSGTISGISKKIKSSKTNLFNTCPNWWGDNSGDMMFFNIDLIDKDQLEEWAKN